MNNFDYLFKFILIGDSFVGKTCILSQYTEKSFSTDHVPTVGVEFGSKTVSTTNKKALIKVQLWDTAGQESFRSVTRSYYRGCIAAVLIYDITKKESFDNLQKWIDEINQYSHEKIQIVIVGNKSDLNLRRQVPYQDAYDFAQEKGFSYYETCAITGENIEKVFQTLIDKIYEKVENKIIDSSNENYGIKVGVKNNKNGKQDMIIINGNQYYDIQEEDKQKKKGCC